jgi:hypothetical protein
VSAVPHRKWHAEGIARAPYWAYSDLAVYRAEQERVFSGRSWCRDRSVVENARLKFRGKPCVFDRLVVPNSLIYPL